MDSFITYEKLLLKKPDVYDRNHHHIHTNMLLAAKRCRFYYYCAHHHTSASSFLTRSSSRRRCGGGGGGGGGTVTERSATTRTRCSSSSNELARHHSEEENVREIIAASSSSSSSSSISGDFKIKPSRLDAFIADHLRSEKITRGAVARSIANGNVFVNGTKTLKKTYKVQRGDVIRLTIEQAKSLTAEPEDIKLNVIYEDEDVIVIDKPAGMVVHPAPGHSNGTLVNALLYHCGCPALVVQEGRKIPKSLDFAEENGEEDNDVNDDDDDDDDDEDDDNNDDDEIMPYLGPEEEDMTVRPGIVHRLDKGTSGLLVCAKNSSAHQHLCDQFAARSVRRLYVALVLGHPNPSVGVVQEPIGRDPRNRLRMSIASSLGTGRFARSNYRTLETFPTSSDTATSASLVEWKLDTGRTHQIRVHSKFLGCGILGDETYDGNKERVKKQLLNNPGIKKVNAEAVSKRSVRPMLHARTIGFTHPRTGESLDFSREPPQDFLDVLDALKKC